MAIIFSGKIAYVEETDLYTKRHYYTGRRASRSDMVLHVLIPILKALRPSGLV